MAITRGPASALGTVGSGSSVAATWTGTQPTAGNKVLVAVQFYDVSSDLTVVDNGTTPRTFTLDGSIPPSGTATSVYIYRADNITLPGGGNYAVTVTTSGGAATIEAAGLAYSGVKAGGPVSSNTGTGTSTSVSTGNATPSAAGALYFASFFDATSLNPETITLTGSGFTEQFTQTNGSTFYGGGIADKIDAGGPIATACTWTLGDSVGWNSVIVAYDAAPAAGMASKPVVVGQAVNRAACW